MKTKEQILEHLKHTGYQRDDVRTIAGYLLGLQITEKGEPLDYKDGDGTFNEFFDWVNERPSKNVFSDIAANLDYLLGFTSDKIPENIRERTMSNVKFLLANKDYLKACIDKKENAEELLNDVDEIVSGLNATIKSIFDK